MDGKIDNTIFDRTTNTAVNGEVLDALVFSPGPSGGRTCDFGSTTQMGSIVVPVGFDESVGVPRGMEIFVRRFDEGTGLGIAYHFEQETDHRRPPQIEPSPIYQEQPIDVSAIGFFNDRAKRALETATNTAPEQYSVETLQAILRDITGQSAP
ncbi:MAG: hypothetical protein R3194_13825, partial [Limnobacter sp.]|nr:hypothetical protein [Limnobacter sp.]